MALSEQQIEWVGWVAGKKIDANAVSAQAVQDEKKQAILNDTIRKALGDLHDDIDEAQKIVIQRQDDPNAVKALWRKIAGTSNTQDLIWRATDEDTNKSILSKYELRADVEIDTVDDIDESVLNIDPEQLKKLHDSFTQILNLQKSMQLQLDENGERIFSDEEIRNELWTPMVRSGLIPDNMVPDDFSEHAIAFKGAQKLYADRIDAYSKTHTKTQDAWAFGLRIAKETVTVTGAIVSGSFTMANSVEVAGKQQEMNDLKLEKAEMLEANPDADTSAIQAQIDGKDQQVRELQNIPKYIDAGTALLNGGISLVELGVEHHYAPKDQDKWTKWTKTIGKGLEIAQGMAISAASTSILAGSSDNGKSEAGLITCVTCSLQAGFTAARLVPAVHAIWKEPDEAKRALMIAQAVGDLATCVASSITAAASQINTVDKNASDDVQADQKQADKDAKAEFAQLASALKLAISQAGNGVAIYEAVKRGDMKTLGMLLGGMAVATAFGATSEVIYDAVREDVDSVEGARRASEESPLVGSHTETTGDNQEAGQDSGSAATLEALQKSIGSTEGVAIGQMKAKVPPMSEESQKLLESMISTEVEGAQQKQAEEELEKAMDPEVIKAMMEDIDGAMGDFEAQYSKAFPDPGLTDRTPEEVIEAQAAIDRAMANTAALRAKVALINSLSGGAAGVISALVPGASAAASAQALARDIYLLVKCVEVHNTWCDSMDVAMAGQGGAAAAIHNAVRNARIHLSQAAIVAILSALKASAEVAKMFDPTGAAAGVSAGASMASAVVNYGYKMQKEADIKNGWKVYKEARSNPGNRKKARKALRLNSTLAKCCIAYGAAMMNDTAAKQAIKATGLTVAAIQNDQDICVRLVAYLENELSDDRVVMAVEYKKDNKWAPGDPALDLSVWTSFKAAAAKSAQPPLAEGSLATPAIDRLLGVIAQNPGWDDTSAFKAARDKTVEDGPPDDNAPVPQIPDDVQRILDKQLEMNDYLDRLGEAFAAYKPMAATGSSAHKPMEDAAAIFATMARAGARVTSDNIKVIRSYPALVA